MASSGNRLIRVRRGIYRRRQKYVVRYRNASGRQRQRTVDSLIEVRRLQATLEEATHRARLMYAIVTNTGMRPADVASLRWASSPTRGSETFDPEPPDPTRPFPSSDWARARAAGAELPK